VSAFRFDDVWCSRGRARRRVEVLRRASFTISPGEVVLLIGPSGSGKTTLLGVAAGLLTPERGLVEIEGVRIDNASQAKRRVLRSASIGMVFQRPSLLSGLTARENILLMASIAGMSGRDGEHETGLLLECLGIASLRHRLPHELSGGEEQRVGIARALVHRPAVILADEPTGSLDEGSGAAVAELLHSLASERRVAVLLATHDLRLRRYASRAITLRDGSLTDG
jgi:ABC-type lipoprotein export system ATPase subunit